MSAWPLTLNSRLRHTRRSRPLSPCLSAVPLDREAGKPYVCTVRVPLERSGAVRLARGAHNP